MKNHVLNLKLLSLLVLIAISILQGSRCSTFAESCEKFLYCAIIGFATGFTTRQIASECKLKPENCGKTAIFAGGFASAVAWGILSHLHERRTFTT